ncbi:transporter substrate-binding domain-containing protein [Colwellia sp. 1_MG-2023]|uniref:ATP-binding protein n=1 Tax=Colwellia sp. 1_MG-2023 TaxID=3062649 RepID=UPI0026E47A46|nr:transporter substrate-binding domain-containing protein [Colwellia sp. 1_MG-2023]MDO6444944.1 transporter substrate-binding domain-containing protein [Colwellia sp. 1_MG-2023]
MNFFSQKKWLHILPLIVIFIASFNVTIAFARSSASPVQENNIVNKDRVIRISFPDQASIEAAAPERVQQVVNFLKEYWQIWAIDNEVDVQFVYLPTIEALKQLQENTVDVVAINIYLPEYSNVLYSIPYAKFKQTLFQRINQNESDGFQLAIHAEDKNTLRFLSDKVSRQYFTDLSELLNNIENFDAIYSSKPWLIKKALEELSMSNQFYINKDAMEDINLHFTTRKNDRDLLALINDNLRHVKKAQVKLWQEKYLSSEESNFQLSLGNYTQELTEQEKQYVIDHNIVQYPITHEGFPPYIITQNQSNIIERGFAIDLLHYASEKLGIIFKPVYVDNFNNIIEEVTKGNAELLVNIEYDKTLEQQFSYSIPYLQARYSIVYNPSIPQNQQFSNLNNRTISAINNFKATKLLQQAYPKATFILFDTLELALTAVSQGNADVFIGRSLATSYLIKKNQLSNLTSQPLPDFHSDARFTFATTKAEQTLVSLLNRTINALSADQFENLYAKWSQASFPEANVQAQVNVVYRQASYVFFAILLIALIIFWIYYRQLQVRKIAQAKVEHALAIAESARNEAERSAQAKITFLARMSHEIRTPMNGILGMAEALNFTPLNHDQKELLDTLGGSARHLLALLNDVLDFSKMDAGKLTLESVPVNFHLLAKNVLKSFEMVNDQKNIQLLCDVDNDITHSYFTDPTRLNQILNNLVSNAIKFTEQGSITLSIKHKETFIENDGIYDAIRISVLDTGIGISTQKQLQLFTPFIQADDDITRKFGGTGLGLSICQEIVMAMGGKIHINSIENKGSEFYFDLKYKQAGFEKDTEDRRKHSRHETTSQDDRFKDIQVLIAEDNLVNVKVLTAQLSRLGIEADIAYDGVEAFAMYQSKSYQLIISDCHMPNMDGFELAQKIKALALEPIWLIAVTADALSGAAEKCLLAGFDDYMAKPCPQEEIANKINHAYREIQKKQLLKSLHHDNKQHSLFNEAAILVKHNHDREQAEREIQAFINTWENEKCLILSALDQLDIASLSARLNTILKQVETLNHSDISALINNVLLVLNNAETSLIKAATLNIYNKLDLFYLEILTWRNQANES